MSEIEVSGGGGSGGGGTVTIGNAVAGSTIGAVLYADASKNLANVAGAAGTVLIGGAIPAFSATPTLGVAASVPGTLGLAKGVAGGAIWTLASAATANWTLTGPAVAPAQGDLVVFTTAAGQLGSVVDVAAGQVLVSGGVSAVPTYSATPTLGVAASQPGTLGLAKGVGGGNIWTLASGATSAWTMTGAAVAPAQGDLFTFSNATGQMSTIVAVASGQVLTSAGVSTVAAWSATPTVTSMTLSGLTLGSVVIAGTAGLLTQDNANWFYDATNHRVYVGSAGSGGTGWPLTTVKFNIYSTSDGSAAWIGDGVNAGLTAYAYGVGTNTIFFSGRSARGTMAVPLASGTGDLFLRIGGSGYGTSFPGTNRVRIDFSAGETWSATAQGTQIQFYSTLNTTTTPVVWHSIDGLGNIAVTSLGNGTVTVTSSGTGQFTNIAGGHQYHYPDQSGTSGGYVYFKLNKPVTGGTPGFVQTFENIVAVTGNGWSPVTNALFTVANYANPETFYSASDGAGHEGSIFTTGAEGNFTFPGGVLTVSGAAGSTLAYGYFIFDSILQKTALTIGYGAGQGVIIGGSTGNYSLQVTGTFGCNNATPQAAFASGGALAAYVTGGFGLDSDAHMHALYTLVANMRTALVNNGIMS